MNEVERRVLRVMDAWKDGDIPTEEALNRIICIMEDATTPRAILRCICVPSKPINPDCVVHGRRLSAPSSLSSERSYSDALVIPKHQGSELQAEPGSDEPRRDD